jgi:hypothetical protein
LGIGLYLQRIAVGPLADAVEAEVSSRVRLLTEGGPHLRIGDELVAEELEDEPQLGVSARER